MRIGMAWLAALAAYPVAAWCVRFLITLLTLPLAGALPSPRPLAVLRVMRLVGGAACGLGGYLVAAWVHSLFGVRAPFPLGCVVALGVAALHGLGLRRLAGGPQFAEEAFSLVGEELGVLAAAAWLIAV